MDGKFQANTNKFKALVQIKSKTGVYRGADLVEEVPFIHEDGKVHHRYDVKNNMSCIKAYNLDIYAFLLVLGVAVIYGI